MSSRNRRDAAAIMAQGMIDMFGARAEIVAGRQFHLARRDSGLAAGSWLLIIKRIGERDGSHAKRGGPDRGSRTDASPARRPDAGDMEKGQRAMPTQDDADYFLKREVEERGKAASSDHPSVRAIHIELAERYANAAWPLEEALDRPARASGLWPMAVVPGPSVRACR